MYQSHSFLPNKYPHLSAAPCSILYQQVELYHSTSIVEQYVKAYAQTIDLLGNPKSQNKLYASYSFVNALLPAANKSSADNIIFPKQVYPFSAYLYGSGRIYQS